jgi:hypothetical protein
VVETFAANLQFSGGSFFALISVTWAFPLWCPPVPVREIGLKSARTELHPLLI